MKRGIILLISILFVMNLSFTTSACDSEQVILKLSSPTNAHAELYDQTQYSTEICFTDLFNAPLPAPHTGGNTILKLSSPTNAHAETKDNLNYIEEVTFGDLVCETQIADLNNNDNLRNICKGKGAPIVALSSPTNAHLSIGNPVNHQYQTILCCDSPSPSIQQICNYDTFCDNPAETPENCPDCWGTNPQVPICEYNLQWENTKGNIIPSAATEQEVNTIINGNQKCVNMNVVIDGELVICKKRILGICDEQPSFPSVTDPTFTTNQKIINSWITNSEGTYYIKLKKPGLFNDETSEDLIVGECERFYTGSNGATYRVTECSQYTTENDCICDANSVAQTIIAGNTNINSASCGWSQDKCTFQYINDSSSSTTCTLIDISGETCTGNVQSITRLFISNVTDSSTGEILDDPTNECTPADIFSSCTTEPCPLLQTCPRPVKLPFFTFASFLMAITIITVIYLLKPNKFC